MTTNEQKIINWAESKVGCGYVSFGEQRDMY